MADGRPLDDVWRIDKINNSNSERIGYPTQKPEELIARMIRSMSAEGDVVADFFAGSGTTCVAAKKLGRRWIGVDSNRAAIAVTRARLAKVAATKVSGRGAYVAGLNPLEPPSE